jgi:hypothetical protein
MGWVVSMTRRPRFTSVWKPPPPPRAHWIPPNSKRSLINSVLLSVLGFNLQHTYKAPRSKPHNWNDKRRFNSPRVVLNKTGLYSKTHQQQCAIFKWDIHYISRTNSPFLTKKNTARGIWGSHGEYIDAGPLWFCCRKETPPSTQKNVQFDSSFVKNYAMYRTDRNRN